MPDRDAAARRAARRAFIRAHHPDVGGDPEEFAAGLAELDRRPAGPDRFDAPVVVVVRPRGLRGVLHRIVRWRARRRGPPRVR